MENLRIKTYSRVSFFLLFLLLIGIGATTILVRQKQEVRTRAQVANCQTLTYPCQEGLISFPQDEGKHDKQVEWWYANFNTTSTSLGTPLAGAAALVRVKQPDGSDKGYALLEITNENNQSDFYNRTLTGTISSTAGNQNVSFVTDPVLGSDVNTIKLYQTTAPFQYKFEITGTGELVSL